jgi:Protein of unknown function (DUF3788)
MARTSTLDPPVLEHAIGVKKAALWTRLHADVECTYGPLLEKWSYWEKGGRWSLQVKRQKGKRTILYLVTTPSRQFLVAFLLGEKAVAAAHASGLPAPTIKAIDAAPRYPEGRLVWLDITRANQLGTVMELAAIKMAT